MQVFNHVYRQPATSSQVDFTEGILPYGRDNSFPLRLAKLVQESPTASAAISILSSFIEGNGFSDPALKDKVINSKGEKFGMVHSQTCESKALFKGITWLIKYNALGDINEIYPIPFENVRLGRPNDAGIISKIFVNPYYGTPQFDRKYTKEYDSFTPNRADVLAQMRKQKEKFKGQILYFGSTRPLSRFYPEPEYYAAKDWMAIDAGIQEYHANNLDAGFFQTVMMKKIGDPNAPSTHPADQRTNSDGTTESFRTVSERLAIDLQPFLGSKSVIKMIVEWAAVKDELPEIQGFPSITNDNFFTNLQETCDRKILTAMKIPGILVNMGRDNSLSDGTQMANATRIMHDRVAKDQNALESLYMKILSRFSDPFTGEVKIVNTNSFQELDKIDPLVWEVLTDPEKRKWIKENTEYPVFDNVVAPVVAPAPVNKFQDVLFTDYPEKAKKKAKEALEFAEQSGGCGTPMGKQRGKDIAEGKPLSFKDIKRIYNYLKRNRVHENKLFSDSCEAVLFHMWGGSAMLDYCSVRIQMIND